MKRITYKFMSEVNHGTETEPDIRKFFNTATIECGEDTFESNFASAQRNSCNGEITVEDIPDLETEPSQEEDTAAMLVDHEYRLTLLELGLTE